MILADVRPSRRCWRCSANPLARAEAREKLWTLEKAPAEGLELSPCYESRPGGVWNANTASP